MLVGMIRRFCLLGAFILAPGLALGQGTTAFPDRLYGEANLLATQAAGDGKYEAILDGNPNFERLETYPAANSLRKLSEAISY